MKNLLIILDSLLSKRQKIIVTTFIISIGFLIVTHQNTVLFRKYHYVAILALISYLLCIWSMLKGMTKTKAILVFILPIYYIVAMIGFYFLFQQIRWLTRIPVALFFGASFYWLLLSQNVFHVASDRAIPLYRAATTANFVYSIFTLILIHSIIFSFNLPFYWNGVLIFGVSLPIIIQSLWAVKIGPLTSHIAVYSAVISLILAEAGIALSFWSASPLVLSLFLNSISYALVGIVLDLLKERTNKRVILEYSSVGGILFSIIFFITTLFT
jgi:hypothetical protein